MSKLTAGLALAASLLLAESRSDLPYCVEIHKRIPGAPHSAFKIQDPRDCQAICEATSEPRCTGFNWYPLDERCELFIVEEFEKESSFGAVSGPRVCADDLTEFPEYSEAACAAWGEKASGEETGVQFAEEPWECLTACQEAESCSTYVFNMNNGMCSFLDASSLTGSKERMAGFVSGPPQCTGRTESFPVYEPISSRSPEEIAAIPALAVSGPHSMGADMFAPASSSESAPAPAPAAAGPPPPPMGPDGRPITAPPAMGPDGRPLSGGPGGMMNPPSAGAGGGGGGWTLPGFGAPALSDCEIGSDGNCLPRLRGSS
uniref:Apple domain-containing protein n=1 Tax=Chromera velia CCMP2878 TaxID=1169474 RepID=A0A0G4GMQ5_9ALVE|eukprot:Cvel_22583.t1-p1 / transcript=Cvel_22583.t1 / gene=Cvel_22583 / organism=Chromera_velia_CCMP2878 / gene_product=hypothetical protein / transcript_product=hypothetical protein / location=Cvel_scaffold2233:9191-10524(+) / protein_length=316 / sequence_SO=supercontig / SO=protein_coding / is_pseudo=false